MASYLRKCVAMDFYRAEAPASNYGYSYGLFTETNTQWIRMWVGWNQLAPNHDTSDPSSDTTQTAYGTTPKDYVAQLDSQIRFARQNGLKVILTFWRYPQWANGSTNVYQPPADVSTTSRWGAYLWWLMSRYNKLNPNANGAWVDFIEVCNEPNWQWPQNIGPASIAARMMMTGAATLPYTGNEPLLLGPGLHDTIINTSGRTSFIDFMDGMFLVFNQAGFVAPPTLGWSMHNYTDIQNSVSSAAAPRLATAVSKLGAKGWTGWPNGSASSPYVMATEGGLHPISYNDGSSQGPFSEAQQKNALSNAYTKVHNDNAGEGRGVGMFTNYQFFTTAGYDSGLCDLITISPIKKRKAYTQLWQTLPPT